MQEYIVDINGEITEKLVDDVVNKLRAIYDYDKYLLNTFVDPSKELIDIVTLSINSPGGIVSGFNRIKTEIDKLKELGIHIKTHVTDEAASCAFLIVLLGDERTGSEFCSLMNHIATAINYGKVTSNARKSQFDLKIEDKFTKFIVEKTKISEEWLEENKEIDQWFDYEDALELGIFTTEEEISNNLNLSDMINQLTLSGYNVIDDVHNQEIEENKDEQLENVELKKTKKTKKKAE